MRVKRPILLPINGAIAGSSTGTRQNVAPSRPPAFTRVELLVILAVLTLLALVVLPALANTRPRSARVICANNLRQIGVALQVWGNDHDDRLPWHVEVGDGGTKLHPLSGNSWFHFAWLSNELASPQLLFCPSDTGRPAQDFTGNPATGYLHPNFANRATSYFLNAHPFGASLGNRMLVGDRNLPMLGSSSCSVLAAVSYTWECPAYPSFGWTSDLHENEGNLLMFDGQVEQANNEQLRAAVNFSCEIAVGLYAHFCMPR
jgi:competence protein ComGC